MRQLALFDAPGRRQVFLQDVPPGQCIVSRYNTRKRREPEQVARLAARIQQNGFELTRAPWAYRNGQGSFEIFAGGTRLEAARRLDIAIPLILFEGYDEIEISQLSDQDNENDEYHEPVSVVDVWAEYARLRDEEGWTQEKIARAKGVSHQMVSIRQRLHTLPERTKAFASQDLLTEAHLTEILALQVDLQLSLWLPTTQAWQELAELAAMGVAKNGRKTVRATGSDVQRWKEFIAYADEVYRSLESVMLFELPTDDDQQPRSYLYDAPRAFVDEMASRQARSLVEIKEAERAVRLKIHRNLQDYQVYVQHTTAIAARQALQAQREQAILGRFIHVDCLEAVGGLPDTSIRLLLIDPPYGQAYQSNRRWRSEPPPRLLGDTPEQAGSLLKAILDVYSPRLASDAHVLVFCSWQAEPGFRAVLAQAGLQLKGSLIWVKEEHSAGDLEGSFAPSHERILHAIQGRPVITPRQRDVLEYARDLSTAHPTTKPIPLLRKLIEVCTCEGDLVVDPLAGVASTLIAAYRSGRDFWGCEIDGAWHQLGCERLLQEIKDGKGPAQLL